MSMMVVELDLPPLGGNVAYWLPEGVRLLTAMMVVGEPKAYVLVDPDPNLPQHRISFLVAATGAAFGASKETGAHYLGTVAWTVVDKRGHVFALDTGEVRQPPNAAGIRLVT
jgi:hypothetical protein